MLSTCTQHGPALHIPRHSNHHAHSPGRGRLLAPAVSVRWGGRATQPGWLSGSSAYDTHRSSAPSPTTMAFTAPLAPRAAGDWAAQDGPPQGLRGRLRAFHQYHSTWDMLPANPPARYNPRSCSSQSSLGGHCDADVGSAWDRHFATPPQMQQSDVCSPHTRHWRTLQPCQMQPKSCSACSACALPCV